MGLYRQLAPGGHTISTLAWNGTSYAFDVETVTEPEGLLGDFNEDGKVDAADYVVWRKNETANNSLPNDGGAATQAARFDLWRANFGEMTMPGGGAGGAVPEPCSAALVMICGYLFAGSRGRNGRR
jgi:hypothetical protein